MGTRFGFQNTITDGLVFSVDAYNKKSYVDGEILVNDLTINKNNGTLNNGVGFDTNSWTFDGINDYIDTDNVLPQFSGDSRGTIIAWVKLPDATPSTLQEILSFNDTSANERIEIAIAPSTGKFRGYCNQAGVQQWFVLTDAAATTDDTWVQVVLTHDGASPALYVNGDLVAQSTSGAQNDSTQWFNGLTNLDNGRVGCRNHAGFGNNSFMTGDISYIKIYNKAFTTEEVKQDYDSTKWRFQ